MPRTPAAWLAHTRTSVRAPFLLALLLGSAACADRAGAPDFTGSLEDVPITVSVQNQHFNDVTVYVGRDVQWQRLGSVVGNTTSRFEIPEILMTRANEFRFRIHAIGTTDNEDYVTEGILVNRGAEVALTVAPVLTMSSWHVR